MRAADRSEDEVQRSVGILADSTPDQDVERREADVGIIVAASGYGPDEPRGIDAAQPPVIRHPERAVDTYTDARRLIQLREDRRPSVPGESADPGPRHHREAS
jgi:hypothetical protein